jgi:hypothetical protein
MAYKPLLEALAAQVLDPHLPHKTPSANQVAEGVKGSIAYRI